jgi:hypothetical protein
MPPPPEMVQAFRDLEADILEKVNKRLAGLRTTVAAQDDGAVVANDHRILNFQGPGVVVTDDPTRRRANVYVPGAPVSDPGGGGGTTTAVASSTAAKAKTLWNGSSNDAPPAGWETTGYSDAAWSAAVAASPPPGAISGATAIWTAASPASATQAALVRQAFTLPAGSITGATLQFAVDDLSDGLWINGTFIAGTAVSAITTPYTLVTVSVPIGLLVTGGANLIAAHGRNQNSGGTGNASVTYKLTVTSATPGTDAQYALSGHTHVHSTLTSLTTGNDHTQYVLGTALSELIDDRVAALLVAGTDITLTYDDGAGTLTVTSSGGSSSAVMPWIILIVAIHTPHAQTNWSTLQHGDSRYDYDSARQSSGAQNAEISWKVALEAGTWEFELIHGKGNNRGIYTVSLDGTSVGTIDGYTASAGTFNDVSTITGISVATTSVKTLNLKMATKNASSSSYFGVINAIQLRRTA